MYQGGNVTPPESAVSMPEKLGPGSYPCLLGGLAIVNDAIVPESYRG
jgi:hypothetical protein